MDFPSQAFGVIGGIEIGGVKSVKYTESYSTLDGLPKAHENYEEDNIFINGRLVKYFDNFFHLYIGVAYGYSNGDFTRYPNFIMGVSLAPKSNIPVYFDFELRTLVMNVNKENIKFNNFGEFKSNPDKTTLIGLGVSCALIYRF